MKLKNLLFLLTLILVISCTLSEESEKKERKNHQIEESKLNIDQPNLKEENKIIEKGKIISNIKEKYNLFYKWDTLIYNYSIDYKPIIESKYQLVEKFEIIDIYEKDNVQYVLLMTGLIPPSPTLGLIPYLNTEGTHNYFNYLMSIINDVKLKPLFYLTLIISKEQINNLKNNKDDLFLIVSISDINKKPPITLIGDNLDCDKIILESVPLFICKGKIIDIISLSNN